MKRSLYAASVLAALCLVPATASAQSVTETEIIVECGPTGSLSDCAALLRTIPANSPLRATVLRIAAQNGLNAGQLQTLAAAGGTPGTAGEDDDERENNDSPSKSASPA